MAASEVAELTFLSYCDVSYAGARVLTEAVQWHRARGHNVLSETLGIVTQNATPAVPLPQLPLASVTVSTVTVDGRVIASYAVIHTALLRTHAAANAAAVLSALVQRGARRIFVLSAVHQPLFAGLRCQVLPSSDSQPVLSYFLQTLHGDLRCPEALAALCTSMELDSDGAHGTHSFECRDAVIVGTAAAAPYVAASVVWVLCNGDRMRASLLGSQSDITTCALLLRAVEALLPVADSLAASSSSACARRSVTLPEDAAFTFHDPPAAGDVIYN
jgi:hypothetical protein